ncbi:MAG: DUF4388 domain-containing protein [candidate division Zixibacteria bacterium]|nr:DUF4388 domain-containing protein [candidate division Zixibacteria bacterium]
MSLSGNLKTVSFPDILQLLSTGKKTGILSVETATRGKLVAFKDGNIIHAASVNSSEDLLGNMLVNRGRISKADLERAITLHRQTGRQLGTTLIDMKIFDKAEVAEVLKQQVEEIVYNLFSWSDGNFVFREDETPKDAPFLVDLSTMNVILEGTRRIDEWMEIQKVLPPDDVMLAISKIPKISGDEIRLSVPEFQILSQIDGERSVSDLISTSAVGEFVTSRSIYRLIVNKLVEAVGRQEGDEGQEEDEEEVILNIIFKLYNRCFYRIRGLFEDILGADNDRYRVFSSQYDSGLMAFFSGADPASDQAESMERFACAVRALPTSIRFHRLMRDLDTMLTDHLQFAYHLLGAGAFREGVASVKREIAEPLAMRRELVKRHGIEDDFYRIIKRADKTVKLVRG